MTDKPIPPLVRELRSLKYALWMLLFVVFACSAWIGFRIEKQNEKLLAIQTSISFTARRIDDVENRIVATEKQRQEEKYAMRMEMERLKQEGTAVKPWWTDLVTVLLPMLF